MSEDCQVGDLRLTKGSLGGKQSSGNCTSVSALFKRSAAFGRRSGDHWASGGGPIVSSPSRKKRGTVKRPVPLYTVGVDDAKSLWVSRFRITERGHGYVHIPLTDWADEELAAQLTSERLVTKHKSGFPVQFWKLTRARNEMLDCAVCALAALRLVHPDLDELHPHESVRTGADTKAETERVAWSSTRGLAETLTGYDYLKKYPAEQSQTCENCLS